MTSGAPLLLTYSVAGAARRVRSRLVRSAPYTPIAQPVGGEVRCGGPGIGQARTRDGVNREQGPSRGLRVPELTRGRPESRRAPGRDGPAPERVRAAPGERWRTGGSGSSRPDAHPSVSLHPQTWLFLWLPVAARLAETGGDPRASGRRTKGLRVSVSLAVQGADGLGAGLATPGLGNVCGRLLHLFALGCDFWGAAGVLVL